MQQNVADVEEKVLTLLSLHVWSISPNYLQGKIENCKKTNLIPCSFGAFVFNIGFVPLTVDNHFIVPPLAFCMGLVTTAFGEVFRNCL